MRIFRKLAQLLDVDLTSTPPADGDSLTYDSASSKWVPEAVSGGGGGGAPTDVDYLVGTASGSLSAEIVVGTTPGGELGGTWASPTVDATHSGSSHASVQAAAEATAAAALSAHESDTTSVHGIADTSALLDTADIGVTVQAYDADLDTYAGITPSANVQSVLGAADYAAIRSLLGLVIGTNVQAFDADLTTWAGLTPSAFFQTLVDDADAATARATLGVIASLFQNGGAQAIKLDDLAAPDDNTDLDASTSKHGLLPKLGGGTTNFLRADGSWAAPAGGGGGTRQAAVTLTNPQTSANAGNSFFSVLGLTDWDAGHWEFVNDVDGKVYGVVKVPPDYSSGGALKVSIAANATSGVTRLVVATKAVADGESMNPTLTDETAQDITVPGTAYLQKVVSFTLTETLAASDLLVVEITHNGAHANDTLAVNTLLFGAWLEYTA